MAKIVVSSNAYRGDVYPFVPIASELARRGHDVTFVCPREFHRDFAAEPFSVAHSGSDSLAPKSLAQHEKFVERWGMKLGGAVLLRLYFYKLFVPYMDAFFDALHEASEGADLLLCHPMVGATNGSMVAEARGIPWVSGDLFPMTTPTAVRPPPGQPNLGPTFNRLMWRLGRSKVGAPLTAEREVAAFRAKRGLDATQKSPVDAMCSPFLNLDLTSPHYVRPEPDWPGERIMTGFPIWAGPDSGRVADDVREFLERGDPPVLVTLGTSAATEAHFLEAMTQLNALGLRGLFLTGSDAVRTKLAAAEGASHHGVWTFAPLAGVLPHCRAVVHSGAHGTNAMVLHAGLPSVVSPGLFDQVWHAKRQVELGTGIHASKPSKIGPALRELLADDSFANAARAFGEKLADENGVETASDAIEGYLLR